MNANRSNSSASGPALDTRALWRARPRRPFVTWTIVLLAALVAYAWTSGDIAFEDAFDARRAENLRRFLTVDAQPFELRGQEITTSGYLRWAVDLGLDRGFAGALATLAISIVAIALAAGFAAGLSLLSARNLTTATPFERGTDRRSEERGAQDRMRRVAWRFLAWTARVACVFLRAIPEYVWAFLFLAMLGPNAWPAILALGIHNAGILGKLGGETIENLDPRAPAALRELGASRGRIALAAVFPMALSRYLLYVFYRFETCVREATVLGMLGVVSLGYWIQDARSRQFYDQMVVFVAMGAGIVLIADLSSALVRAKLRRAR